MAFASVRQRAATKLLIELHNKVLKQTKPDTGMAIPREDFCRYDWHSYGNRPIRTLFYLKIEGIITTESQSTKLLF